MASVTDCSQALGPLLERARVLGIDLNSSQQALCVRYCQLVMEANARFNLTAFREPERLMCGLVLDSLALAANLPQLGEEALVVDVGSGAGVPGIPLKIIHPGWRVMLMESVGKKARFLEAAVSALSLKDVQVVNQRAEEAGWGPDLRDNSDLCVARAVAPLPTLIELCAPFVRPGGWLAFPKGGEVDDEIAAAQAAALALRLRLSAVTTVPEIVGLGHDRSVVLYEKLAHTQGGYPRRTGLARSKPIK